MDVTDEMKEHIFKCWSKALHHDQIEKEIFACWTESSTKIYPTKEDGEILFETDNDGYFIGFYRKDIDAWAVKGSYRVYFSEHVLRWNPLKYAKNLSLIKKMDCENVIEDSI